MNSKIKSGSPGTLFRLILAILLVGMCQYGTGAVPAPIFSPASRTFSTPISVEILAGEGYDIYYRTDGKTPVVDEKYKYSSPVVISSSTRFDAIAADADGNTSDIATCTYTCRHGIGEGYDPDSPGNPEVPEAPEKTYRLTVVSNPTGAGSSYSYDYKAGTQVQVYTSNNTGFDFVNWTIEDEEVSNSTSFYYVMPEYDVTIVANYAYNPSSPGNPSPEEQKVKHPVVVRVIPTGAGSVSPSGTFDMEENASRQIYAYPNTGWHLTGWTVNGEQLETTTSPIDITMGQKALDIVAYFTYNPESPSNPAANYYNPTTGQVIIDDFKPGSLYDAMRNLVGYDNFKNISSLVVKGEITSNDLGNLGYASNAATIDISRTGGVSALPGYTFSSVGASSIILPSTISSLGNYVFSGCGNLASLTVYAQVPPVCSSYTFSDFPNKANCTVYVPAYALELYNDAEYWKDFTILPITDDAHVLQVNLPADASDGRYKHYSLEIVNIDSGVRQKYVISDRMLYTFNGLQKDEQYNIYLYSQAGLEIGRIENVVIPDQDIEVTFDSIKELFSVFAKVITPDGADVTSDVSVEWLKPLADGNMTYLRKAVSLGEIPEGEQLICRVTLGNKLGVVYANPEDAEITVGSGNNTCTVNLVPFRAITLSGTVVDGDGAALSGASVAVNQTLNGKYSKTYTAKTGRDGKWGLSVLDATETRLTFAASECVNVNDTIGAFQTNVSSLDLGNTTLKSIVGARVSYGFTYHAAGSEDVQDYYSDYQNVMVDVFNVTQNRAHKEVSLQYPVLAVLDENINAGDELRLTATSKTGAFNPIEQIVTIGDDQRAEVTFDIVGKGGISASFEMTDNPAVIAMLYSSKGELLKKQIYSEAKAAFTELEDGDYTLVSMGQSDMMGSILRLSNYGEIGLAEGKDYVKNAVKVESGRLTEVKIPEVPAFDESQLYYTNSATGFSSNKSSITTGNYLTLSSAIDFKGVYKNDISNVALVVDLPEACDFVEQSVIQGPNLLPYTLDNNRLTIQLGNNYMSQTRFCVIPTTGGSFNASASIVFDYNGRTITQPIGSAASEIKDIEISVPNIIADNHFTVSGTAVSKSKIFVYGNNELIGSGIADARGVWNIDCVIDEPLPLSKYIINAAIVNQSVKSLTESKEIVYDGAYIIPRNVHMTFYNGWLKQNVDVNFNFETSKIEPSSYMFYTKTDLTFIADFTNNSPEILKSVVLYIYTQDNKIDELVCTYDSDINKWVASKGYNYGNLPVNMAIGYLVGPSSTMNFKSIDSDIEQISSMYENLKTESMTAVQDFLIDNFKQVDCTIENQIEEVLNIQDSIEYDSLDILLNEQFAEIENYSPIDDLNEAISEANISYEEWLATEKANELDELCDYGIFPPSLFNLNLAEDIEYIVGSTGLRYVKKTISSVDETDLLIKGYIKYDSDSGDSFYALYSDDEISFIDTRNLTMITIGNDQFQYSKTYPMSLPWKAGGYPPEIASCMQLLGDDIVELKKILSQQSTSDEPETILEKAKEFSKTVNNICTRIECVYTGCYYIVSDKAESLFSKAINQCEKIIAEQTQIIQNLLGHSKSLNDEIKALREANIRLSNENADIAAVLDKGGLSESERKALQERFNLNEQTFRTNQNKIGDNLGKIKDNNAKIKNARVKRKTAIDKKAGHHTQKTNFFNKLNKLPKGNLSAATKLGKISKLVGRLSGGLGILVEIIAFFEDLYLISNEEAEWIDLLSSAIRKLPCEGNENEALSLVKNIALDFVEFELWSGSVGVSEFIAIPSDIIGLVQPEIALETWFVSGIANAIGANILYWAIERNYIPQRGDYWLDLMKLKCGKKPEDPDDKKRSPWKWPWKKPVPPFHPTTPIHDPSGYVYEAVPENRVEGVQASIYYKETKEDMYGDLYEEIMLWNAEEYAQKNPLFTDEKGMYQWDVPQGLWQVKFEKDGYVTAYSEWLPVPPPQLEVNIGIVQNKQPEVTEARAYEEGVEVQFDKFMDPSTLTAANIYVTANGEKLKGEIRLIDSALADEYASEDDANAVRYASRVRFVPEEKLSATTGEIRVTVSRNVRSYAGIPMTETFSQVLDVEKEVQAVYADDVKVLYGGEKEVTVYAIPSEAAVGRKLHIANSSDLITTTDITEATLDEEGKAIVKVKGDLPGRAQLTFTIDDVTVTGECAVDVVTELITAEAPKSSRASGTAVYRGTKIELTTESKNATIYFTTDGSCPCDENGTRRKYTVPIVINEDTRIIAMTSVGDGDDDISETVEFNYTLKRTDMDFQMEEGWTWISHNLDREVTPAELASDENVTRIVSQTDEVIRDPEIGMVGSLTGLSASQSYKVVTSAATKRQRISDVAWNPETPLAVMPGWNWLGYPLSQTMTVDEAFATTEAETLDVIVGQGGFAQFDGEKWVGTLETMSPGAGYMYSSQSAKKVIFNTSIVSNASARYVAGIAKKTPLVLDIHKYGSIMPVVATVTHRDGSQSDNEDYQVAAFCGTECRGIGRVVNGLVMMNVYGNANDPIAFVVTDAEGGQNFANDATVNFSETVVGNIHNPFVIAINDVSGIESVGYNGNIKVWADGDMLRIKGIAADDIDFVEIYDLDGRKLMHRTHIQEPGIRISDLGAGAYVVIVNGNGEYTYHKIAIR